MGCDGARGLRWAGFGGALELKRDDFGFGRGCYWTWVWCVLEHEFWGFECDYWVCFDRLGFLARWVVLEHGCVPLMGMEEGLGAWVVEFGLWRAWSGLGGWLFGLGLRHSLGNVLARGRA